ncbi:MAG TPA: ATP-binding protein [Prolixibacteraceae bacterium]|nr:ATP-binding protein [Prolixibacteraceae bacterium]HPR86057.1 ATP-binding protein [Prolixibacteraceae bacterium]
MFTRCLTNKLLFLSTKYPVVTITGPRQSGKSTLVRAAFPDYRYVSLEDPDTRLFAEKDSRGFLTTYSDRTIIDESQYVPQLFSYIQTCVDKENREGMYILAGSHNFLLMQSISQTLAGRTAILKLLPLSHIEMEKSGIVPNEIMDEIFMGGYPRIFDKGIEPSDFYPYYLHTYVERDVRLLKNIGDLSKFISFIKLCAGRIGQLLNITSLANDCGIAVSTAQNWISVLEASYIIHFLKPEFKNYSKRLVKTPKLYFYDTGLACSLLEITSKIQLNTHYLRGGLFENLVINEFMKYNYNLGRETNLSFWRDKTGHEIDLLMNKATSQVAIEIKSGSTYSPDQFKGIGYWEKLSDATSNSGKVIYTGEKNLTTMRGEVIAWQNIGILIDSLHANME